MNKIMWVAFLTRQAELNLRILRRLEYKEEKKQLHFPAIAWAVWRIAISFFMMWNSGETFYLLEIGLNSLYFKK